MKTRLKTARTAFAVAHISPEEIVVSLAAESHQPSIRKKYDIYSVGKSGSPKVADMLAESFPAPGQCKSGTRLAIILSASLTLYSRQEFPSVLAEKELAELVALQLGQRAENSSINTYYDYFELVANGSSLVCALFEARQDLLSGVIGGFQQCGFNVVTMLPEQVVVINQIIMNSPIKENRYGVAFCLGQQGFVVEIQDKKVVRLAEAGSAGRDQDIAIDELYVELSTIDSGSIVLTGAGLGSLERLLEEQGIRVVRFPDARAGSCLAEHTINWMRDQDDLYQSVALA